MMLAAVNIDVEYERLQKHLGYQSGGLPYRRLQWLTRLRSDITVTLQQGDLFSLQAAIDAGTPPTVFVFTGELSYWSEAVYHAVVLVGYTATDFYIHDPAFVHAPQIASKGDLDLAWLENDSYFAVVERIR